MEESRRTSPTPQSPTAQRRLQACERCWKRKQKCDRLLPGCTACIEAKANCCPRSVQLGGTAEDASGLSNAALPDYIETLKRKAEVLDDQSRRRRPRLSTNTSDGRPSLPSNIPTDAAHDSPQTSHDTPLTDQTSLTERSVQAAMGEIEFLSRNAMAEPRGEAKSGIELFASSLHSTAMQSFPTILGSNDDLNMLHSMQLMIIYSMFSSMGGSTWHLVGLAMKKAISYRFHKEPLSDIGIPEQKLNRRRNIFWNLYILDRTISCAMDRPFSIEDEDVTLQLPSHGDISPPDALDFPACEALHISNQFSTTEVSPTGEIYLGGR
ncbi:hypothetical protein AtubIFM57143_004973 [Aspergillus tubingensis]|nr:hypothetical protein AtubIFM57143_004973 [Aspergillus tubingensis]